MSVFEDFLKRLKEEAEEAELKKFKKELDERVRYLEKKNLK